LSNQDESGDVVFGLILLFIVIPGLGHFIWGIIYEDGMIREFYIITFVLSIVLTYVFSGLFKENKTTSINPPYLSSSIITVSATGGLYAIGDWFGGYSWNILYMIILWVIHIFILLIVFGYLSDVIKDDTIMTGFIVSSVITTGVMIHIYTDSISTYTKIGEGAAILIGLSFIIKRYVRRRSEEMKVYENEKAKLIREMEELLK